MQKCIWNKQITNITRTYSQDMFSFARAMGEVYPTAGLLDSKKEHSINRRYRC